MATHPNLRATPVARKALVPNAILGVLIFIVTEAMLFAGLISAFVISKSGAAPGAWPPPGQPRLPVEETLINTIALVVSGILVIFVNRDFIARRSRALAMWSAALALGTFFLLFQGWEWTSLITSGLTMHTSNHGAFFYLIVGMHGLHVVAGLSAMAGLFLSARAQNLSPDALRAGSLYWGFVVGLWPILYWLVYL